MIPRFSDLEWEYVRQGNTEYKQLVAFVATTQLLTTHVQKSTEECCRQYCGSKRWTIITEKVITCLPQVTCRYRSHRAISPEITRSCAVKPCIQNVLTVMIYCCKTYILCVFYFQIFCKPQKSLVIPFCSHEIWRILCLADKMLLQTTISCCYCYKAVNLVGWHELRNKATILLLLLKIRRIRAELHIHTTDPECAMWHQVSIHSKRTLLLFEKSHNTELKIPSYSVLPQTVNIHIWSCCDYCLQLWITFNLWSTRALHVSVLLTCPHVYSLWSLLSHK